MIRIRGTSRADVIDASYLQGPLLVQGRDGDDNIFGSAQGDVLGGGDGNDYILGGAGSDRIFGHRGHDCLGAADANNVRDELRGGLGNDVLYAGTGGDVAIGGTGNDAIYMWGAATAYGGLGNDFAFTDTTYDAGLTREMVGGKGGDLFEVWVGGDITGTTTVVHDFSAAQGDGLRVLARQFEGDTYPISALPGLDVNGDGRLSAEDGGSVSHIPGLGLTISVAGDQVVALNTDWLHI